MFLLSALADCVFVHMDTHVHMYVHVCCEGVYKVCASCELDFFAGNDLQDM